ncbi:MAG: Protease 3 [Pseudomonas sp.]|nr:MAG: Protease 3 [Pseudomonas sp.]
MPAPAHPFHRQLTLANGLQVSLRHAPRLKRSAAALRVAAGSHDVPLAWPGLAHFLEHLLFLGTERFPANEGLMAYVQRHGGQVNASTRERTTDFFFETPVTAFEPALERLANMLTHPRLTVEEQLREREVLQAEYVAWSHDAAAQQEQALLKGVAQAHPLRGFHAGNRDSLPVERQDFQQALWAFYGDFYQAGQMTLSLAGPQSLDQLQALAQQFGEAIKPGQRRAQVSPPALLTGDEHHYELTDGQHWHLLIAGDTTPEAIDFLCTWLNTPAPGGLLAELQTRQWASALKATPLYQFAGQALLDIDVTLRTENSLPVKELLHDWLSFFAHSDWTPLREEYALLEARKQETHGALALARQQGDNLSDTRLQALRTLLDSLQLAPAKHTWQLPQPNPFLRHPVKEERPGLIRGQTSAHRGLRTFAQDRSRGRKELAALAFSQALPDDTAEGALYLRWQFDSPQHADFFPHLENSLRPLSEQARQAGVELSCDAIGNSWHLKLIGLHEPMPAVLEHVARALTRPDENRWQLAPSDALPTMAIRQLLKALPDSCNGINPATARLPAAFSELAALWKNARWQGLGIGLPASCETAINSAAARLPGQATLQTGTPPSISGQPVFHCTTAGSSDTAVLLFCPTPTASLADEARWRVLAHLAQAPFYQRLRTELQLGYAVFSGIRQFNGQTGLLFGVQSPTASVEVILEHLHTFLNQLPELVDTCEDLAQQFSPAALSASHAAELLWQAHLANHPSDYLMQLQQAIQGLTRQDLLDATQQLNAAAGGRVYLTHIPAG